MSPRKPKNPSRVFLARLFGLPWREVERECRRLKRQQKTNDTTGVEPGTASALATNQATEEKS